MTARSRCVTRGMGLFIIAATLMAAPLALADLYEFTMLVDTSGEIVQMPHSYGAALNNNGDVAFKAYMGDGVYAILRADGETLTVIASTPDFNTLDEFPDINDNGLVAFGATVLIKGAPRPGVFTGDGDSITVVGAPNSDPNGDNYTIGELNASGLVAMGRLGANSVPFGVTIGTGGPITHLYDSSDFGNGNCTTFDLTDTGLVSVIAGAPGVWRYIYMGDINGSLPICIVGLQEFNSGVGSLAVNNNGIVAFTATHWQEPTGYISGVYRWVGGPTGCDDEPDESYDEIASTAGPFYQFDPNGSGIAIDDAMTVAFKARLDTGGYGIYTGPDPVADKVVATGDELDGHTLTGVALNRFGMNSAGQIAFYARYPGVDAIYLATPVTPCPADLDGDGLVNSVDLTLLLGAWAAGTVAGDIDGDGDTDSADLTLLLGAWAAGGCL